MPVLLIRRRVSQETFPLELLAGPTSIGASMGADPHLVWPPRRWISVARSVAADLAGRGQIKIKINESGSEQHLNLPSDFCDDGVVVEGGVRCDGDRDEHDRKDDVCSASRRAATSTLRSCWTISR